MLFLLDANAAITLGLPIVGRLAPLRRISPLADLGVVPKVRWEINQRPGDASDLVESLIALDEIRVYDPTERTKFDRIIDTFPGLDRRRDLGERETAKVALLLDEVTVVSDDKEAFIMFARLGLTVMPLASLIVELVQQDCLDRMLALSILDSLEHTGQQHKIYLEIARKRLQS